MSEYKNVANIYDPLLYPAMQKIRKAVLREIKERKAEKIIDLCCGTGNQLKVLNKYGVKNTFGVDLSEDMLAVAAKGSGANCKLEDASATGFTENEFDVAIISFALHEKPFEIAHAIVDEAKRIVKQGGVIMVVDYLFDEKSSRWGKKAIRFVEKHAGEEHFFNFNSYLNYGGLDKLIDSLKVIKQKRFHMNSTVMRIYEV
jgi:demethylmenaquinone methyltransferase/2-methoxy-6-polyprenyl-1,4-benzoquinol methylase